MAISQFYLECFKLPTRKCARFAKTTFSWDVFSINEGLARRTENARRQREKRRRRGRNCTGWNGTPVKSKANRVAFYGRKDRGARGGGKRERYIRGKGSVRRMRGRWREKTTCINDMMDGGRGLCLRYLHRDARKRDAGGSAHYLFDAHATSRFQKRFHFEIRRHKGNIYA